MRTNDCRPFAHPAGEVHVITQAVFGADTNQWVVNFYANLVRVTGTSTETGITYLGLGAANANWAGATPGPPNGEIQLDLGLVSLAYPPNPFWPPNPVLPVTFYTFVFGPPEAGLEGMLSSVEASFGTVSTR